VIRAIVLFGVGVLRARAKHFLNRRSGVSAERRTLKSPKVLRQSADVPLRQSQNPNGILSFSPRLERGDYLGILQNEIKTLKGF
jgi:hypothetical protein